MPSTPVTLKNSFVCLVRMEPDKNGKMKISFLLMVKNKKGGRDQVELPGGKIDLGEDPAKAGEREFQEETGEKLKHPKVLHRFPYHGHTLITICTSPEPPENAVLTHVGREHNQRIWMSKSKLTRVLLGKSSSYVPRDCARESFSDILDWVVNQDFSTPVREKKVLVMECKYGVSCHTVGCEYKHPVRCRYGADCHTRDCGYAHGVCEYGTSCTRENPHHIRLFHKH